jgi:hypothetical protein
VPRLEAPAPTATIPSAVPETPDADRAAPPAPVDRGGNPTPATAGLLVLAALLLGGGGVAAGPPGIAGRLWASLRDRLAGGGADAAADTDPAPAGSPAGAARLVPLSVVEDAPERAGRILPPT